MLKDKIKKLNAKKLIRPKKHKLLYKTMIKRVKYGVWTAKVCSALLLVLLLYKWGFKLLWKIKSNIVA